MAPAELPSLCSGDAGAPASAAAAGAAGGAGRAAGGCMPPATQNDKGQKVSHQCGCLFRTEELCACVGNC